MVGMLAVENQIQWGDVATWLASIGTLLAFAAALYAIWLQRRDFNLSQRQGKQSQASAISIEASHIPRETARGQAVYDVTVHNASAAPIFGCTANLLLRQSTAKNEWTHIGVGTVAAGQSRAFHVMSEPATPYVEVGFTDSDGRHWVRRWTGSLIPVPLPPSAIILGGPQGFELAEYLDPQPRGVPKDQSLVESVDAWARETKMLNVRVARKRRAAGHIPE